MMTAQSTDKTSQIVDLLDRPDALATIVSWIDTEWGSFSGRTLEQTHSRFADGIERDQLPVTHLGLVENRPAGIASLRVRDSVDFVPGTTPWICNVFVDQSARGHGLASALCGSLEDKAEALGFTEVFLATTELEGSLYHRRGFEEVERVSLNEHTHAILRKSLA